jgi:cell wall assembly regulator SMI1
MDKIWKRIEEWLARNAPEILTDLQPPASAEDIQKTESELGVKLPEPMAASYRIHNGSRGGASPLLGNWRLLSLEAIQAKWRDLNAFNQEASKGEDELDDEDEGETEPDPGVGEGWWRKGWIPAASNSSGDFFCVDLDPAPGGRAGQIIAYLHAEGRRKRVADDFGKWLGQFADELESGEYTVREGWLERLSS